MENPFFEIYLEFVGKQLFFYPKYLIHVVHCLCNRSAENRNIYFGYNRELCVYFNNCQLYVSVISQIFFKRMKMIALQIMLLRFCIVAEKVETLA